MAVSSWPLRFGLQRELTFSCTARAASAKLRPVLPPAHLAMKVAGLTISLGTWTFLCGSSPDPSSCLELVLASIALLMALVVSKCVLWHQHLILSRTS